jgi:hypothetical protein
MPRDIWRPKLSLSLAPDMPDDDLPMLKHYRVEKRLRVAESHPHKVIA